MKKVDLNEGGCLCGAIRYQTIGVPQYVGLCHCRYCQLRTASAFGISVYFGEGQVSLTKGTNLINSYKYPTESGRESHLRFCRDCGTTLLWSSEWRPGMMAVGGGTFDPPTFWYDVEKEIFCRSKADFVDTTVTDKFDTGPVYLHQESEDPRLKGL